MNNKVNSKKNNFFLILKIIASIIFLLFASFVYFIMLFLGFDNLLNTTIANISFILVVIIIIIKIWNRKYKKVIINILLGIFLFIFIGNFIYFYNYSMKIEPLIYLHNKYNLSYSNMKVVETEKRATGLFGTTPRSATIKYNDINIYLYYSDGWIDNYKEKKQEEENNYNTINKISSIMKSYTNNFKIVNDPYLKEEDIDKSDHYGYIIFLNTSNEDMVDNIIKEIDNYIIYNNYYITYNMYIVKENKIYNGMINIDMSNLSSNNNYLGQTSYEELLEAVGYKSQIIKHNDSFDKALFMNNYNEDKYQNDEQYKYIIFNYEAEKNSFVGYNKPSFNVIGINK